MVILIGAVCWCRKYIYISTKCALFHILQQTRSQIIIQCHDNKIWKHMCIKTYLIVLRPIINKTYKRKTRSIITYELYITNWSYSYKLEMFFDMYRIMIPKGTSWAGTRLKYGSKVPKLQKMLKILLSSGSYENQFQNLKCLSYI